MPESIYNSLAHFVCLHFACFGGYGEVGLLANCPEDQFVYGFVGQSANLFGGPDCALFRGSDQNSSAGVLVQLRQDTLQVAHVSSRHV